MRQSALSVDADRMKRLPSLRSTSLLLVFLIVACVQSSPDRPSTDSTPPQNPGLLPPVDLSSDSIGVEKEAIVYACTTIDTQFRTGRFLDFEMTPDGMVFMATVRGVDRFEKNGEGIWNRTGAFDTPGHSWSVCRVGNRLWVADDYAGVTVLDAASGAVLATWSELHAARFCVRVGKDRVLVCRHSAGAALIQTPRSSPDYSRSPVVQSFPDIAGKPVHAVIDGATAYISAMTGGYQAWDLTDAKQPRLLWSSDSANRAVWSCHRNGLHLIADQKKGLVILRDRNGGTPETTAIVPFPKETRSVDFVTDTMAVVAATQAFHLIDLTDPEHPSELSELKAFSEGRVIRKEFGGIIASDNDMGWHELVIENDRLAVASSFELESLLTDVVCSGDLVFAARTKAGVQACRIDASGRLTPLGSLGGFVYAVGIDVSDNTMAVVDYDGLRIVDVSDPSRLEAHGYWKSPGRASGVRLHGKTAWVADWFHGVHQIDFSDRDSLRLVSTVKLEGWATDLLVTDRYVYVCAVNGGLYTIDHSDPENPVITARDERITAPEGVTIGNGVLYVADFNSGLIAMDLSDPGKPVRRSFVPLTTCKGVSVQGSMLLLGDYIYGVRMYDIRTPFEPVLVGRLDTPGKAYEAVFTPLSGIGVVADWHDLLSFAWAPSQGQEPHRITPEDQK